MKVDFDAMSNEDLKRYMLSNRDSQEAFYAYMDRRHAAPAKILITAEEAKLPFDEYIKLSEERMRAHFGNALQPKQPQTFSDE